MTTYIELTEQQAGQIGKPFSCDRCGEHVGGKDGWGCIAQPDPLNKRLKVCLLCTPCLALLVPVFREFFKKPGAGSLIGPFNWSCPDG